MEAPYLARRAVCGVGVRVVDKHVVSLRLRREKPVHRLRREPPVAFGGVLQAFERRLELAVHHCVILVARPTAAPLQSIELVEVEQVE